MPSIGRVGEPQLLETASAKRSRPSMQFVERVGPFLERLRQNETAFFAAAFSPERGAGVENGGQVGGNMAPVGGAIDISLSLRSR